VPSSLVQKNRFDLFFKIRTKLWNVKLLCKKFNTQLGICTYKS